MVETITPVVHGGSRARWGIAVAVHTLAATLTAAAFGAILGAAGGVLEAPWGSGGALAVAVVAAWAFVHEAAGVPFPVPQLRRQVPDWWRTFFSPFVSAALYGGALGIGFFTYLQHATLVVVCVAAFASGRPVAGALLVGAFGLARGSSTFAAVRGPGVVHTLAGFARRRARLAAIHAAALAAVAAAAAISVDRSVDAGPLASAVIAVAFAWSAAWKTIRPRSWRGVLDAYRLGPLTPPAAVAVPALEAAVAILALAGVRRAGAILALTLLTAFTATAVRRRLLEPGRVPCGCFGASETTFGGLLARNAGLALVAGVALSGGAAPSIAAPVAADVVPIVVSLGGILGLIAAVVSVRRSVGGRRA